MRKLLVAAVAGLLVCSAVPAGAQDPDSVEVSVLDVRENGFVLLQMDGDTLLAMGLESARKALKDRADLEAAERKLAAKDSLLARQDSAIARYESAMARQRAYIEELEKVAEGYKGLAQDYKELRGEPWLTVEGGVGATGDSEPAVLMGVAVRRLRVWGFLQESNAGGLVGVALPVF